VLGLPGFLVGIGTESVCAADWDADGGLEIESVCAADSDWGKDSRLATKLVCAADSDRDTDGELEAESVRAADSDASGVETDFDAGSPIAGCNSEKLEIFLGLAVSGASAAIWRSCSFVGSVFYVGA
jgi:hypothetical protein